jgi:hypothetical protein
MSTAIENCLYITGVVVHFEASTRVTKKGWSASLQWQDSKFTEPGCVKGEINTCFYENSLTEAIDSVVNVAEKFNVFNNAELNVPIGLYYKGDGKDKKFPPLNDEWNYTSRILQKEAEKRGWESY